MAERLPMGVMPGPETRYYVAQQRACDHLLRCADCKALVLLTDLKKLGCCPCGNKRVREITMLSEAEHAQILSGALDFPDRIAFLAEFGAVA